MSIEAINGTSNVSFKGNETKTEEKQAKTPEQVKDGKKKLALAAAGVATLAIAGIAIANHVRKGKPIDNKEAEAVVENGKKAVEEVVEEGKKVVDDLVQKGETAVENIAPKSETVVKNTSKEAEKITEAISPFEKRLLKEKQARLDLFSEQGLEKLQQNGWAKELYNAWIDGKGTYRYDYKFIDDLFKAQIDKETGKIQNDVAWESLYRIWEFS